MTRCPRCESFRGASADRVRIYRDYHDNEWGRPCFSDAKLYEMLVLEGAQAGLSWISILCRRDAYRAAFAGFDVASVASFDQTRIKGILSCGGDLDGGIKTSGDDLGDCLSDGRALKTGGGIIKNRLKVESAVKNAQKFLQIQGEFGSFSEYFWGFTDGKQIINQPRTMADVPPSTPLSDKISQDLKRRGFSFVGSVIIYSYMQAVGMVCDHLQTCDFKGR